MFLSRPGSRPGGIPRLVPPVQGVGQLRMMNSTRRYIPGDLQSLNLALSERLSERSPRATDDESEGYAERDIWITRGRCWRAARVAYPAVWLPDRATDLAQPSLPFDVVSGCVAAYGSIKLRASYKGPAMIVERDGSSTVQEIRFIGKEIDVATADASLNSLNRIVCWNDQSHNGFHAISSGAHRPVLPPIPTLGSRRGVLFDSGLTTNARVGKSVAQYLKLPNELLLNSGALTIIVYAKASHAWRDFPFVELFSKDEGSHLFFGVTSTSASSGLSVHSVGVRSHVHTGARVSLEPAAYGVRMARNDVIFHRWGGDEYSSKPGNVERPFSGGLIAGTVTTPAGSSNLAQANGTIGAVLIYNRRLSSDEMDSVFASLYYHFEGVPQLRGGIVFDGDSITNGAYGTYYLSWPDQLRLQMSRSALVYNVAVSGGRLDSQINNIPRWKRIYNKDAPFNELVFNIGSNDIHSGSQAFEMKGKMEKYLDLVRAEGRDWSRIVLGTVLPRGSFNQNPDTLGHQWRLWNDLVRENAKAWGVTVLDWMADPTLGDPSVVYNPRLFGDPTHPTVEGLAYMAAIARAELHL